MTRRIWKNTFTMSLCSTTNIGLLLEMTADKRNNACTVKKISILVKPSPQGYLHIIEIRDNKNAPGNLITLMSGKIEFKDNAKDLNRITQEFMDKYRSATRNNAELIELWRIYDELDQEAIRSDAAEMGYIKEHLVYRHRQQ